jgi:hypothetical protein
MIHDTFPQLQTAHQNNRYLTDLFVTFGYLGEKLIKLNECHMWKKAITVADITTADRKLVTKVLGLGPETPTNAMTSYGYNYSSGLEPPTPGMSGDQLSQNV